MHMQPTKITFLLSAVRTGQQIRIAAIPHGLFKSQFIRLGIHEGERVECLERLPGGTIVLKKNRRHIAVGHELAKQIQVHLIEEKEIL